MLRILPANRRLLPRSSLLRAELDDFRQVLVIARDMSSHYRKIAGQNVTPAQILMVQAACHLRKKIVGYMTLIQQDRDLGAGIAESDEENRFGGDVFR
jgi:hypothetical protein